MIPGGLCFTFGRAVLDKKQGVVLFKAMSFIFFACLIVCTTFEYLFSISAGRVGYRQYGR
ncbi:MAG: potassium-transporting ATPase subunit KdpA [Candidatus Borkfalkia sp.]